MGLGVFLLIAFAAAVAAAVLAVAARRPRFALGAAVLGSVGAASVRAAQPTLFRAENGFAGALLAFGILAGLVGLAVGLVARHIVSGRASQDRSAAT